MAKKIWKVDVSFVGEAPADGERILKEVKTLLEYDRIQGGFGKMPHYWYGIETGDDDGIYPVMVETRRRVKNKVLKRTEIKREFRTVRIKVEFLNREWRTVMSKSGIPVYYAVAV